MKKQELIKHIEDLPYKEGLIVDKIDISRKGLLELVKQLDEPGKVQIPQFVADWLEQSDWREETLGEQSVFDVLDNLKNDSKNGYYENVNRWIDGNGDLFARAWLDGYEIQETRYVVTDGNHLYFKGYQEDVDIVILVDEQPGTMDFVKKFDSKEEAQKVADILGWKVQEVE
nr:MAG TPA: Protein of unknown function (DUF1642) [Caudoviricetes sp.]